MKCDNALFCAVIHNRADIVKFLLDRTSSPNTVYGDHDDQFTILTLACRRGSLDAVKLLIEYGANITSSVLHECFTEAARCNRIHVVEYFLNNIQLSYECAQYTFFKAARDNRYGMMKLFIDRGIDVNMTDSYGYSALSRVVDMCHRKCIILLLKHGANPECKLFYHTRLCRVNAFKRLSKKVKKCRRLYEQYKRLRVCYQLYTFI